jgi:hypothetical protein
MLCAIIHPSLCDLHLEDLAVMASSLYKGQVVQDLAMEQIPYATIKLFSQGYEVQPAKHARASISLLLAMLDR